MPFFTDLATAVASNLLSALSSSSSVEPLKVIEVSSSSFASRAICKRNQCLVMYGPSQGSTSFELVLNLPVQINRDRVYSLCRGDEQVVRLHFDISSEKLPILYEVSTELCTLPRLHDLWSVIINNPSWTAIHIVAHFGLVESLKNSTLVSMLGTKDEAMQMTPLHVAAKGGKYDFIKSVISLSVEVPFTAIDSKGNSLYHYAAQTNKETVEVLEFCKMGDVINLPNQENQTPLHLACLADKPDCVKALIAAGANINLAGKDQGSVVHTAAATSTACAKEILTAFPNQLHAKDMKNGGTPLHWATTKELVTVLVELGCQVNARNFSGETALHVMIHRDRFECVVFLLTHGADPNLVDSEGNAPLHLAVKSCQLSTVQALVSFGADVNLLNHKGDSPRHLAARRSNLSRILYVLHSIGAKRCAQKLPKCGDGCSPVGKDDGKCPDVECIPRSRHLFDDFLNAVNLHPASPGKSNVGGRILALDGGGIRGLVMIQMLQALEAHLGAPVVQHFDWIAGTSTGGILAIALLMGKSVQECKALYFRFKDKVFVGKRPYDETSLEHFLRTEFGDKTMADLKGPRLLVTAVIADTIPSDLHLFRNYPSPQELLSLPETSKQEKPEQQLVWQAARASGAAPTYFRSFKSFLDGGLIANNPTLDLLTEIQEYNAVVNALGASDSVVKPTVVVSLGTGCKPTEQVNTLDLFRPESLLDTARLAFGVSAFGKLLVDQVTCSDRRIVDRSRSWCSMIGATYFRLSPSFTMDVPLDETREDFLVQMLWETQAYVHSHQNELKKISQLIKA